jgi:hypothetical protein
VVSTVSLLPGHPTRLYQQQERQQHHGPRFVSHAVFLELCVSHTVFFTQVPVLLFLKTKRAVEALEELGVWYGTFLLVFYYCIHINIFFLTGPCYCRWHFYSKCRCVDHLPCEHNHSQSGNHYKEQPCPEFDMQMKRVMEQGDTTVYGTVMGES